MVRVTGLEPAHLEIPDPKSGASANSAIPADKVRYFYDSRNARLVKMYTSLTTRT